MWDSLRLSYNAVLNTNPFVILTRSAFLSSLFFLPFFYDRTIARVWLRECDLGKIACNKHTAATDCSSLFNYSMKVSWWTSFVGVVKIYQRSSIDFRYLVFVIWQQEKPKQFHSLSCFWMSAEISTVTAFQPQHSCHNSHGQLSQLHRGWIAGQC